MNETLTVKEVAKILQLHPVTVRRNAKSGDIPGNRVGHQWRFERAAIEQLLKQPAAPAAN